MISVAAPVTFLSALLLAFSPLAMATAAPLPSADSPQASWSVQPAATSAGARPSFEYAVDAGSQIKDVVIIVNSGPVAADFEVYATDGINDFATGGLSLLPAKTKPKDLGAWISVTSPTLHLEPGTQARVPFTALIPSDASPGDHVAGIIASSRTTGNSKGQAVVLDQRVGARVNLRVAGPIAVKLGTAGLVSGFSPSWNPFAPGSMTVDYAVKNKGNLRLDVTQKVDIVGPFGIHLGSAKPKAIENLLPGQSVHVVADVPAIAALALAWSTVELVPGPVGSAAAPSSAPSTSAATAAPTEAAVDPAAEVPATIDYASASASTMGIAISWTLLLVIVVTLMAAWVISRYVRNTRDRMYDAIDQAAADAREQALGESRAHATSETVSAR